MAIYQLNEVSFNSDLLTLTANDISEPIDPKLAALLELFIDNPQTILSRDDLLGRVWEGAIVSDNTINRSISQLRKALDDDAKSPRFIKTVAKKGYQFVADIGVITEQQNSSPAAPTTPSSAVNLKPYLIAAVCLLAAVLTVNLFVNNAESQRSATNIVASYPLTTLPGRESGGELSPDGLFVAFLHRPFNAEVFQIHLQPFTQSITASQSEDLQSVSLAETMRNSPSFALTNDGYRYTQVIWANSSDTLFAVRSRQDQCEIVEMVLTLDRRSILRQRVISACQNPVTTKLAMAIDSNTLYMVAALTEQRKQDLHSYDLESGAVTSLLDASNDGAGFKFIDVNLKTGELLLLQDLYWRETTFMTVKPDTLELTELFHIESIYYSAFWSQQRSKIWLNWGNDTVIEYNVDSDSSEPILQTTVGFNYDFHPVSETQAIYTVSDADVSNLALLTDAGTQTTPTSFREYGPQFSSSSGKLAYVSNQSGLPQIWLRDDEQTMQVTDVTTYKEFYDLAWSLDEQSIIAIEGKQIGILDFNRNAFRSLLRSEHKPFMPSISAGHSYFTYSEFSDGKWSVNAYQTGSQDTSPIQVVKLDNASRSVFIDTHRFVFSEHQRAGLWMYDIKSGQKTLLWDNFPEQRVWWEINNGELIYSDQQQIYRCRLLEDNRCAENDVQQVIKEIPTPLYGRFSYDRKTGNVVMTDRTRNESNLRIAEISQ